MTRTGLPVAAVAALFSALFAGTAAAADVTITDAWIRALPVSVPSGGYFILHNGTRKDRILTGASSPACGTLTLHETDDRGGMSGMRDMTEIPLPAGGTIKFSPGGYHLMCLRATSAIKPGKTVPVTLKFSDGSNVNAVFAVRDAAGK